jgi:hypothetical protein
LSEYRADLPRTFTLVVVLLMTAAATSALAREFHAAGIQGQIRIFAPSMDASAMPFAFRPADHPQNVTHAIVAGDCDRKPFQETMARSCEKASPDSATDMLIERIRRVE